MLNQGNMPAYYYCERNQGFGRLAETSAQHRKTLFLPAGHYCMLMMLSPLRPVG